MIDLTINGIGVSVEDGTTILEACRFLGIDVPALCHKDGLSSYGACRLCTVEVDETQKKRTRLVASCLYPVKQGLNVRTDSKRVIQIRKMLIELLLARCPNSKTLQDLASSMGIGKVRFKMEHENCILCGLCVRMCTEQMNGGAIAFSGRGTRREVSTPFHLVSEVCRNCGACMYICPVVETQCRGVKTPGELCNACLNLPIVCVEDGKYDHAMCYLKPCIACMEGTSKRTATVTNS
jgi:NADH dehydrogenase/NADH:ubiquinone oxidoreductase subunit G